MKSLKMKIGGGVVSIKKTVNCWNCGEQIQRVTKFCPHCGGRNGTMKTVRDIKQMLGKLEAVEPSPFFGAQSLMQFEALRGTMLGMLRWTLGIEDTDYSEHLRKGVESFNRERRGDK